MPISLESLTTALESYCQCRGPTITPVDNAYQLSQTDVYWTRFYRNSFHRSKKRRESASLSAKCDSVTDIPTFYIKKGQPVAAVSHVERNLENRECDPSEKNLERSKNDSNIIPSSNCNATTENNRTTSSTTFPLYRQVFDEARNRFLEDRAQCVWEGAMLDTLEQLIHNHCDSTSGINFKQYLQIRSAMHTKFPHLVRSDSIDPSIFGVPQLSIELFVQLCALHQVSNVSGASLMQAIMRDVFLYQTRIDFYAMELTSGFIRDVDVESFLSELIPLCAPLTEMPSTHYPFFLCASVRRFAHFLPTLRHGSCTARRILSSTPMEELIEVALAKDRLEVASNWFSYDHSLHIFEKYRSLDVDRDGMLSLEELRGYKKGCPTLDDPGVEGTYGGLFLSRFFECGIETYEGKIDYKKFVEFVLLVETLPNDSSLDVYWRIFDLHKTGFLTPMVINLFVREVYTKLEELNLSTCTLEQLVVECMDVMGCGQRVGISKEVFLHEKNRTAAGTLSSLMVDYHAVVMHEQREANLSQQLAMLSSGMGICAGQCFM